MNEMMVKSKEKKTRTNKKKAQMENAS